MGIMHVIAQSDICILTLQSHKHQVVISNGIFWTRYKAYLYLNIFTVQVLVNLLDKGT